MLYKTKAEFLKALLFSKHSLLKASLSFLAAGGKKLKNFYIAQKKIWGKTKEREREKKKKSRKSSGGETRQISLCVYVLENRNRCKYINVTRSPGFSWKFIASIYGLYFSAMKFVANLYLSIFLHKKDINLSRQVSLAAFMASYYFFPLTSSNRSPRNEREKRFVYFYGWSG